MMHVAQLGQLGLLWSEPHCASHWQARVVTATVPHCCSRYVNANISARLAATVPHCCCRCICWQQHGQRLPVHCRVCKACTACKAEFCQCLPPCLLQLQRTCAAPAAHTKRMVLPAVWPQIMRMWQLHCIHAVTLSVHAVILFAV